jgi:pimeloyl-ACP methyl ester carboxylesterase
MTNIDLGQTIDGSLSSTDTNNPKRLGRFSDDYTLTGISNWQQVQVNLDSTAIDSYLQLVNASTGAVITDNNNFLDSKNSKLNFTVVPGINYAIRATSFNTNETGNYTIKTSSLGTASSLVITGQGQMGTVDPLGRFAGIEEYIVFEKDFRFTDIALSYENKIFALSEGLNSSELYSINPVGSSSIGNFPSGVDMRALEFSPSNILYGASTSNSSNSSQLYTINPQTGAASFKANFPWEANSGGDLVFDPIKNQFLLAESNDSTSTLFSVSLTGQSTKIGDIGFGNVYGLSLEGSTLVGFTGDNKRIIINPATGKGTFDRNITGLNDGYTISGAGSIPSATQTQAPTPPAPTPPTPTPTVSTPNKEELSGTIINDNFVDSETDVVIRKGIIDTANSLFDNPGLFAGSIFVSTFNDTPSKITERLSEINQPVDTFRYGILAEGTKKDTPRNISLQLEQEGKASNIPIQTWVIIHGWNDEPSSFKELSNSLKNANPNDRVLLLDWNELVANGKRNKGDNSESPDATIRLGNYFAAKSIASVAEFVVEKLKELYGIDGETAFKSLNLIGHSLGSLVSSEIGRIYKEGTNRKGQNVASLEPNETLSDGKVVGGVNTIIALDPPSKLNIDFVSSNNAGYDLDGSTAKQDSPKQFRDVSRFSRAFVGSRSIAGNQEFAGWANESFQMNFGFLVNRVVSSEHTWVHQTFRNLIQEKNDKKEQAGFIVDSLGIDNLKSNDFKPNAFLGLHEGVLYVNPPQGDGFHDSKIGDNQPIILQVQKANQSPIPDDIIYGSNRKDTIDGYENFQGNLINGQKINGEYIYTGSGNDQFYGDVGDDEIFGGEGNDTINGDQGNDSINGEQDNDTIFGGANNDKIWGGKGNDRIEGGDGNDTILGDKGEDTIFGGKDNDSLEGNDGKDTLIGGEGDDTLWGGGDSSADSLDGGEGNDSLIGEGGNDTLIGGLGADNLNGGGDDDVLIGGQGKDVLKGDLGSDIFVFSPGDGASNRDDADIITDFGTGFVGLGGADKIGLAGGLKLDMIEVVSEGGGGPFGGQTALKANGEFLAIINGKFNKTDLNFQENFKIL